MRAVATPVAVLLAGALAGCSPSGPSDEVDFRLPVSVREVEKGNVEDTVVATGTLRAPQVVSLRAETGGILQGGRDASGRKLAEGDRVEPGQVIAEITGEDVRIAARTEATEQRFRTAERDHESRKRLYQEGLISEDELRRSEDTLADARLELDRSRLTETRSTLVTPIDGIILELARDERGMPFADGQLVTQGMVIAQVAPVHRLIADVDLVGTDIARVREGLSVRIRHHAWDETFSGRVLRLAPSLDPVTRALRAEVGVDNPDAKLRPGMFIEVTIVVSKREEVPVVPREAVTERGGTKVVFVLRGQKVAERQVVLGFGDDDTVEIREGVEPGEKVVVRGLETLSDDTRVRVSGS